MNRSVWARTGIAAAVVLMSAVGHVGVANAAEGDSLSLKIANALRSDRLFMRAGAIYVKVKTKSGNTYDVTGPVVKTSELEAVFGANATTEDIAKAVAAVYVPNTIKNASGVDITLTDTQKATLRTNTITGLRSQFTGVPLLINDLVANGAEGIGTPPNIKAKAADSMSTAGFSLGYFLDDDYKWMVETYVLAAPISTSAYGAEGTTQRADKVTGNVTEAPLTIGGQKIVTTKLLPPTAILGRYWGSKGDKLRVFTGGVASYIIFFDSKATEYLNTYVGGSTPGSTTVSMKNKMGFGPALGVQYQIDDSWHLSLNVAQLKVKTQATITTRSSKFDENTPALQDLGAPYQETINTAEIAYGYPDGKASNAAVRQVIAANGGVTAVTMKSIAAYRNQQDLGTYVRKTDLTLTNTLFFLSVGKTF